MRPGGRTNIIIDYISRKVLVFSGCVELHFIIVCWTIGRWIVVFD